MIKLIVPTKILNRVFWLVQKKGCTNKDVNSSNFISETTSDNGNLDILHQNLNYEDPFYNEKNIPQEEQY